MEYNLKQYAHIGDAVWELFVRELVIKTAQSQKAMHEATVKYVNANFQAHVIEIIDEFLNDEEKDISRRGRNLPITINKRCNPQIHRGATSLEVLVGYWYLNNKKRLNEFYEIIKKNLTT